MSDVVPPITMLDGSETTIIRRNGIRMQTTIAAISSMSGIRSVAGEALTQGMPLAVSRLDGTLRHARADTYALSFVCGLASADTSQGNTIMVARASLTLLDWTLVTGGQELSPGQIYFLAPDGGLTTIVPVAPDSICAMRVGQAVGYATFVFDAQPLIRL